MDSSSENLAKRLGGRITSFGKSFVSPLGNLLHNKVEPTRISASPGIEYASGVDQPPPSGTVALHCIDYGATQFEHSDFATVEELIAHPRPEWTNVRWINVEGLHPYVINELRKAFDVHTLAAEDALNTNQRAKLELFENHSLIVMRMSRLVGGSLSSEQVSLVVTNNTLITFQEKPGDVWDPVRTRIQKANSRFRSYSIWYLAYALTDAIVDNVFPILENYGETLNDLEEEAMTDPKPSIQQRIYIIKRELYGLRRATWPMRELASKLTFDDTSPVDEQVKTYMRDVHDHALQIIDLVESAREMANSLQDLYISIVSNRMNEVMKALTIMASLFMPITFLAGLYGMNFEHIPELDWRYSYPVFLTACITCTAALLFFFKRKGWIGK